MDTLNLRDNDGYVDQVHIFDANKSYKYGNSLGEILPLSTNSDNNSVQTKAQDKVNEVFAPLNDTEEANEARRQLQLDSRWDTKNLTHDKVLSLSSPPSLSYSLRSSYPDPCQALEKLRKKHNCIRELYNTEWQFAQDMAVVVRIYLCASAQVGFSVRQIDTLFSNISEVLDISLCTVAILEANIPKQILHGEGTLSQLDILADKEMHVGRGMCIALTGSLYEIYEYYIHRNKEQMQLCHKLSKLLNSIDTHEQDMKPLKKSQVSKKGAEGVNIDVKKLNDWFNHCRTRASKFTTAWALDCLLIKPIQRLGKYPLFLKTILECTSPESEAYEDILRAYKRSKHYLDCVNSRLGKI